MIRIHHLHDDDKALNDRLEAAWRDVLKRDDVGFPRIPEMDAEWSAIDSRRASSRPAARTLVIGIGGSSLGTQVIYEAFRDRSRGPVVFLESPDPQIWKQHRGFDNPEWDDKHVVIVSKSGNTLETLAWVERLNFGRPEWLKTSQVTVIASPGEGPLQTWAQRENLPTLWIPADVGGRFSVLTAVGMLPAALMGLKIEEFRRGAAWALERVDLAARLAAQVVKSWERGERVTQMWSYAESLKYLGDWWQQLWSESLGKKLDRHGRPAPRVSSPVACRGPRDQHSQVQQLVEAPGDKFVFVNRVTDVEEGGEEFTPVLFSGMPFHDRKTSLGRILGAEAQAFERSLGDSGVPYAGLTLETVSEASLGAYFMLWQMVTALLGEHLGINAYDQPGVEIGKKHAHQILTRP